MKAEKAEELYGLMKSLQFYERDLIQLNKVDVPSCVVFGNGMSTQYQIKTDVSHQIADFV